MAKRKRSRRRREWMAKETAGRLLATGKTKAVRRRAAKVLAFHSSQVRRIRARKASFKARKRGRPFKLGYLTGAGL